MNRSLLPAVLVLVGALSLSARALPPVFLAGDLDSALEVAKRDGKLVLLYLYSEYTTNEGEVIKSDLCQRVEDTVLAHPDMLRVLSSMVCIAACVDDKHNRELLTRLKLPPAFPTFVWIDREGRVLATMGACFTPSAYGRLTATALEIEELLGKGEQTPEERRRLGLLYFDAGRYAPSADVLRRSLEAGEGDRVERIACAIALRVSGDDRESLEMLNEALTTCRAREPLEGEINLGPLQAVPYAPIAFEREGAYVGNLSELAPAQDMAKLVEQFEWALTVQPATTAEAVRAADILYARESWARAALLYERAVAEGVTGDSEEVCAARAGVAALRAGDATLATEALERYLAKFEGANRHGVLFFRASLLLAESVEVDPTTGMPRRGDGGTIQGVVDRAKYNRAGELLLELMSDYPESEWRPAAKDLLSVFFPSKRDK